MGAYRVSATTAVRQFSEVLRWSADGGQEVLIQRHRRVVARLVPAGPSPVRWNDLLRTVHRERSPDSGFWTDLAEFRGLKGRGRTGPFQHFEFTEGTVLLDATLLVDVHGRWRCLDRVQRVATTAAAVAELSWIAAARGPWIQRVRVNYISRVLGSMPVISLDQAAALQMAPRDGAAGATSPFVELARATAESVYWPLVGAEPLRAKRKAARGSPDGSLQRPSSEVFL